MFRKRKRKGSKGFVTRIDRKIYTATVYFDRHERRKFTVTYSRMRTRPNTEDAWTRTLSPGECWDLGHVLLRAYWTVWPRRLGWYLWLWRPQN